MSFRLEHPPHVGDDDLRRLAAVGSEAEVAAGQLLVERGQPGSGMYVVLDGSVVVEAPEGTQVLGPGSLVGERALLTRDGKRSARVRALADVRVLAVARPEFERLWAEDAGLPQRLAPSAG